MPQAHRSLARQHRPNRSQKQSGLKVKAQMRRSFETLESRQLLAVDLQLVRDINTESASFEIREYVELS